MYIFVRNQEREREKREKREKEYRENFRFFSFDVRKTKRALLLFSPLSSPFFCPSFGFLSAPLPWFCGRGRSRPKKEGRQKNEIFSSILGPYLGSKGETKKNLDEKSSITPASSALTLSPSKSFSFFVGIYNRRGRARARAPFDYLLSLFRPRERGFDRQLFFSLERKALRAFPPKRPSREREKTEFIASSFGVTPPQPSITL
jgi:hypothetical protein